MSGKTFKIYQDDEELELSGPAYHSGGYFPYRKSLERC